MPPTGTYVLTLESVRLRVGSREFVVDADGDAQEASEERETMENLRVWNVVSFHSGSSPHTGFQCNDCTPCESDVTSELLEVR